MPSAPSIQPPPFDSPPQDAPSASSTLQPLTPSEIESIVLIGPEDSRHWSQNKKWLTTVIISLMGFISPLGSSILVPGNGFVDHTFTLNSRTLSLLPVSLFVIGLGIGPFVLAPCSETVGRQPVYVITSLLFIVFNLASAFSPNFVVLNVLRIFAGAAGSTGPSLGAGSIGDMFAPRERGRAQSLYGLGPLMGPVLGSIIGCFIAAGTRDWRWLLHTLTIMSAVVFVIIVMFLDETYAPVLLRKKREKAVQQRQLEIDQQNPKAKSIRTPSFLKKTGNWFKRYLPSNEILHKIKTAQSRPFRLLFTNPICAIFSYYLGFCYGIIYLFLTQHPLLFQTRAGEPDAPSEDILPTYNWGLGISGLSYLGLGLGFLVAAFTNAALQDEIYARLVLADGKLGWFLFKSKEEIKKIMKEKEFDRQARDVEKQVAERGSDESHSHNSSRRPSDNVDGINSHFGNVTPIVNPDHTSTSIKDQSTSPTEKKLSPPPPAPATETKKGRPEYRLPLCFVGMLILPLGLLLFGWSAANQTHFIVPLIGSFVVGCATILCFQTILVYLVDAFVPYSASATACAVLIRSLLAAAFPLCAEYMFEALGYGWSCTLLAGIGLLGLPVPLVLFRYGEGLRSRYKFKG
ncbi:multidrug transporter [Pseudozyma hubeiensis SY62]|uniref:Multidrug transporter n=1 Tax=Pseudozyma hubeiensis (strain SY62) TaxID=1305764 RepID=R9P7N5_PSEHS|nr:multidrug transporter [Pseudozyma hubeiensis SY62]GAC97403.1 multidrug transporter [Pseudozyma hubeiensis SY62]